MSLPAIRLWLYIGKNILADVPPVLYSEYDLTAMLDKVEPKAAAANYALGRYIRNAAIRATVAHLRTCRKANAGNL